MKKRKLSSIIAVALTWTGIMSLAVSLAVSAGIMIERAYEDTSRLLKQGVADVSRDISDMTMDLIEQSAVTLESEIWEDLSYIRRLPKEDATAYLNAILEKERYTVISIVDVDGVVAFSTDPDNIGYDFHSAEQSEAFLVLLKEEDSFVQEPRKNGFGAMMQYAGAAFPDRSGFVQLGIDQAVLEELSETELFVSIRNRRIGEDGSLLLCDGDFMVLANSGTGFSTGDLNTFQEDLEKAAVEESVNFLVLDQEPVFYCIEKVGDYYIIGLYPAWEGLSSFQLIFIIVYIILRSRVVKAIESINGSLARIAHGDLEEEVDVRNSLEFDALSDNINLTVGRLKKLAKAERERLP